MRVNFEIQLKQLTMPILIVLLNLLTTFFFNTVLFDLKIKKTLDSIENQETERESRIDRRIDHVVDLVAARLKDLEAQGGKS